MTKQPFDKLKRPPLNHVLDECLALLEGNQVTLEECLARYPQHAADLRPLLEIALEMRRVARSTPGSTELAEVSLAAFATGKRRMLQALAEKKRRQPSPLSRCREWIAALFGERWAKPAAQRRAPAFQVALAAALALVLLVNGGLFLRSWLRATITRMATLDSISGVVEVRPAGKETWLPAWPAQRLEPGARVRTSTLSAARLVFFDGSTTDLEAETEIAIAQMISRRDGGGKVIALYQWLGRSHNRVQPLPDPASRFEIETPTTVAVVRGTEFSVAVEADGATQVAVWEGFVEVTAREKTVQVQPGEMTRVQPNLPPAPPVPAPTRWPPTPTPEAETPQPTRTPTPEPPQLTLSGPEETPKVTQKPEPPPSATPTPIPSPTPTPPPTPTETPALPPTPPPLATEPPPPTPTETPTPPPTPPPPATEPPPPTPTETPTPPPTPPPPATEPIEASQSQGTTETPTPMND
jgi:hypothetical protein